jgi:uncharacterized membrane protein YgaE (UPF0421/DUF939 family)
MQYIAIVSFIALYLCYTFKGLQGLFIIQRLSEIIVVAPPPPLTDEEKTKLV